MGKHETSQGLRGRTEEEKVEAAVFYMGYLKLSRCC